MAERGPGHLPAAFAGPVLPRPSRGAGASRAAGEPSFPRDRKAGVVRRESVREPLGRGPLWIGSHLGPQERGGRSSLAKRPYSQARELGLLDSHAYGDATPPQRPARRRSSGPFQPSTTGNGCRRASEPAAAPQSPGFLPAVRGHSRSRPPDGEPSNRRGNFPWGETPRGGHRYRYGVQYTGDPSPTWSRLRTRILLGAHPLRPQPCAAREPRVYEMWKDLGSPVGSIDRPGPKAWQGRKFRSATTTSGSLRSLFELPGSQSKSASVPIPCALSPPARGPSVGTFVGRGRFPKLWP